MKAFSSVSITNIDDGSTGAQGASVAQVSEEYYVHTSYSSLPSNPQWQSTEPTNVDASHYIWKRLKTTLSDGTIKYSDAVCQRTISGVISRVNTVEQNITNKIWQSDITTSINDYDSTTTQSIRDDVSEMTQDLSGFKTTVSSTYATQTSLTSEINKRKATYVTCSTGASTQAKVGTCANFELYNGATITCVFSNANTKAAPTLNVNSTGAKTIVSYDGSALDKSEYEWSAGSAYTLVYDGTNWRMQDSGTVTRLSVAESSIEQNAENIELKVSKDGVISSINQSAESITINADKVNIEGATLFSSGRLSETNLNNAYRDFYAVSETASGTANKTTQANTPAGFTLYNGATVTVKFNNANTATTPTLNVNGTGAKTIKSYTGAALTAAEYKWAAGSAITFVYDGSYWRMQDGGALQAKADASASASAASSSASSASSSASSASSSASSASSSASTATNKANEASASATTATNKANEASASAETASDKADEASASASSASGSATTATNKANEASASATNAANSATAAAEVMGGFTILWNYENFSTANNGEGYICLLDPATGTRSDSNGWVKWNGTKRTITKQMVNPNTIAPYNIPIYVVTRLSSASSTTGTNYIVWYNSGWKYASLPTPSAVGGTWTWNNDTDMILGKFVETASEGAFTDCEIFNPPLTAKHVTTDTVTARSANAAAAAAQSSANSAVKSTVSCYYRSSTNSTPTISTSTTIGTSNNTDNTWSYVMPAPKRGCYFYTCEEYTPVSGAKTYSTVRALDSQTYASKWVSSSDNTYIDGGRIYANSVTTSQLATDAIQSLNYDPASDSSSPYSSSGSFFDLSTGNIYTPNFGVQSTTGRAYLNGEIIATSGTIGDDSGNYWEIGNTTDTDGGTSASIVGNGTAYIQDGDFQIHNGASNYSKGSINTQWYATVSGGLKITYPYYSNTYYDYGMTSPILDTTDSRYYNATVSQNFLYIRKHASTIPTLASDWNYVFRVDKDGNAYVNNLYVNGTSIATMISDGVDGGAYLPTSGGTVSGNVTITGTLTATASKAIGDKNGSDITTTYHKLAGSNTNTATNTFSGTNTFSKTGGFIYSGIENGTSAGNRPVWFSYLGTTGRPVYNNNFQYNPSTNVLTVGSITGSAASATTATKATQDASGNVITETYAKINDTSLTGTTIAESINSDEVIAGSLIVNGDARFVNTINGDISGNAATATTSTSANSLSSSGTIKVNLASTTASTYTSGGNITPGVSGTLPVGNGGTGKSSWTQYGILYASASNTLAQLGVGTSGQVLTSKGSATPEWTNQSSLSVGSATKDGSGNTISSYYAPKSTAVTNVAYDSTNKKITKTINGTTSDIVTTTTLKSAMELNNVTNNKQVKGLSSGTTSGHLVTWGSDGYTIADSGIAKGSVTTKITLSGTDYSASSNAITITKENLQDAVQDTSYVLMTSEERSKLSSIAVSSGGTIDFSGVTASAPLTATVNQTTKAVNLTHNTSGVTAGTYKSVTVNTYGHVTGGTNPTTLSGYGITDAKIASGTITLGSNTITPLTADSSLNAAKLTGTASVSTTGNATTATKFSSTRKIELTGDTTGSATADGSSGWSIATTTSLLKLSGGRIASANNFYGDSKLRYLIASSSMTTGKPVFSEGAKDALILHFSWDNNGGYDPQLAIRNSSGELSVRGGTGKTNDAQNWTDWHPILDSNNYTTYTVTKTGTGASGTWGINISGTATTATYSYYPKFVASNELRFDINTKPSSATTIYVGYKWSDNTLDAKINRYKFCNGNAVAAGVEASTFYGSLSGNATSATKATNDSDNNPINTTYAKLSSAAFTGAVTGTSFGASSYIATNTGNSGTAGGLALYATNPTNYGIAMRQTSNSGLHGYVQGDWAIYSYMSGSNATNKLTRGWIFKNVTDNIGVASISGAGNAVFNGSVTVGGNTGNTSGARMEFNSTNNCIDFIFN